jgi:alkanesulfonate monooxygenase SsuD/methylene tetrahydromethanopterin reductase-like flavin-dependent oxidoreductase (luciferase family)
LLQEHFNTVWFDDHFHKDHSPVFESWTTLSYLASLYPHLRFGTLVLCQSYRNPGLLAKMMATLQVLSSGRYIAGIGAGWKDDEYHAYNYPYPPARTRLDQLEELVQILRIMWTQSPASFEGEHYRITNAECEPLPTPPPPLLIGGGGEKRTLRIVAEYADWMNLAFPDQDILKHKLNVLRQHCDAVNRPYDEIKKSMWTYVRLSDRDHPDAVDAHGRHIIAGTPKKVMEEINRFSALGIDHMMIRFVDFPKTHMAEVFISEVIPGITAI